MRDDRARASVSSHGNLLIFAGAMVLRRGAAVGKAPAAGSALLGENDVTEHILAYCSPGALCALKATSRALSKMAGATLASAAWQERHRASIERQMWSSRVPAEIEGAICQLWSAAGVPDELASLLRHVAPEQRERERLLRWFGKHRNRAGRSAGVGPSTSRPIIDLVASDDDDDDDAPSPTFRGVSGCEVQIELARTATEKNRGIWRGHANPRTSVLLMLRSGHGGTWHIEKRAEFNSKVKKWTGRFFEPQMVARVAPAEPNWHGRACARHPLRLGARAAEWRDQRWACAARYWRPSDVGCCCQLDEEAIKLFRNRRVWDRDANNL